MEKYIIKGGKKLKGEVRVSGAKNATLKLMAASILTEEPTLLRNVPNIKDVYFMCRVLEELGFKVRMENRTVEIKPHFSLKIETPYELVSKMRASIGVLGPLLARLGKARVALPGGCNIGSRKIDLHLRGLEVLRARIKVEHGFIEAEANGLVGDKISLDFPSVGATENLLMAAVLAEGTTFSENAAHEPEIVDLANFLNKMGAKIKGAGTFLIEIQGVKRLHGVDYTVMSDRIEAGTFIVAAVLTKGEVYVKGFRKDYLELVLDKFREAGLKLLADSQGIWVAEQKGIKAIDIVTLPYPGFPTDLQPQVMVLLSLADGTSIITENVFESRFAHVEELKRFGCDIETQGHHAIIRGTNKLNAAKINATDLRGGAALVLAGLVANGSTQVGEIHHIDRGYEHFEQKLRDLGADIIRQKDSKFAAAERPLLPSQPWL